MKSNTFRLRPPPLPPSLPPPLPPPKPRAGDVSRRSEPVKSSVPGRTFPTIRLSEDAQHITVVAIVPGFSAEDLDITLASDVVCVTGRARRRAPTSFTLVRKERRAVDFSRSIKLGSDVARGETEARLDLGVLTLRMRKCGASDRAPITVRL